MSITLPEDGLRGPRLIAAVSTLVIAIGMASLDTSIANTALPTIAADVNASPADSVWVVNAYQLALVVSLLPLASLGEIIGYRRGLYMGPRGLHRRLAAVRPKLVVTHSDSRADHPGLRRQRHNERQHRPSSASSTHRNRSAGASATTPSWSPSPPRSAPPSPPGILSLGTWQWLFAINVPLGIVAFLLAFRALPDTRLVPYRFDYRSAALNAATFGFLIFGIGEAAHEADIGVTISALAIALIAGVALIWRQLGLKAPMLPVDLYRRPMFALSSLTSLCSFAAQGLAFVSLPFYFQTVLGFSAVETGLLLTPWPVMTAVAAPIAGPLSDRYPPAVLGGIGLAVFSAGLAAIATLPAHPGLISIVWRMMVCGAGFGFFQSPNLRAIMSSAPPERSGGASGIVATSRLVGQAIGAAPRSPLLRHLDAARTIACPDHGSDFFGVRQPGKFLAPRREARETRCAQALAGVSDASQATVTKTTWPSVSAMPRQSNEWHFALPGSPQNALLAAPDP